MNIDKWIHTKKDLKAFAKELALPSDWHNADCHGIEVMLYENSFDNAHCDKDEAFIVLKVYDFDADHMEAKVYAVNAANLFAWAAAGTADGQRRARK